MTVLLNVWLLKSLMDENMVQKLLNSSDLGYVSNILTLPSIICTDKRSGGFKVLSRYFAKNALDTEIPGLPTNP